MQQRRKIRVLIVEDSRLYQVYLSRILEREPCVKVAGIAGTGREVLDKIETLQPDVVTLDLNLPDMSGFEVLKELLARHADLPVIVVSSQPEACEEALCLGARDYIEKITDSKRLTAEQFALLLQMKIKMLGGAAGRERVRKPKPDGTEPERVRKPKADGTELERVRKPKTDGNETERIVERHRVKWPERSEKSLIAIGASVGGTESTLEILRELPEDMPGILVVQHMPVGFTRAYALRLNQNCRLLVAEAKDGDRIMPGKVLLAPSGRQMEVAKGANGYYVRCRSQGKVGGFCPSVEVLFSSIAETDAAGIAVILTGMGRDGVDGIRRLHEKGFYTIGQEKESCVVFGMPQEAQKAGALDELLNPKQIAERLVEQSRKRML